MATKDIFAPPSKDEISAASQRYFDPPSEDELRSFQVDKPKGFLEKALTNVIVPVGRFVDKYTGAPSRAALGSLMEKPTDIKAAGTAFAKQFGERPENAPTGEEIAGKMGYTDKALSDVFPSMYSETGEGLPLEKGGFFDPTAKGTAGLGIDVLADWSNVVPVGLLAKGTTKAVKGVAKGTGRIAAATGRAAGRLADVATGTSVGTGTVKAAEKVGDVGSEIVTRSKEIIDNVLNPKRSANYGESVEIAKKNGIDPSLLGSDIEFGRGSAIARLERSLREGATGEPLLEQYEKGRQAISDAIQRKASGLGAGPESSMLTAGDTIQKGLAETRNKLFNDADITFNKVQKHAPGLYVNKDSWSAVESKLRGLERSGKGLQRRGLIGTQKEQGSVLLDVVNGVRRTNGSFKQSVEALQNLGDIAFKKQPVLGRVAPDVEKMRDLYFTMRDALIDTVSKDVSPQFAQELIQNNKKMSEFFKDQAKLVGAFDPDKAAEHVFQRYVKGGSSQEIKALMGRLSPADQKAVRGAYLNSLIDVGQDGAISFKKLANALRKNKEKLSMLFSPSELKELSDVVRLGVDYGDAVLSYSGTGASSSFREFGSQLMRGFRDEQALEAMKSKARGAPGLLKSPETPNGLIPSTLQPPTKLEQSKGLLRGPKEKRLKAAQSISPSLYTREREE